MRLFVLPSVWQSKLFLVWWATGAGVLDGYFRRRRRARASALGSMCHFRFRFRWCAALCTFVWLQIYLRDTVLVITTVVEAVGIDNHLANSE